MYNIFIFLLQQCYLLFLIGAGTYPTFDFRQSPSGNYNSQYYEYIEFLKIRNISLIKKNNVGNGRARCALCNAGFTCDLLRFSHLNAACGVTTREFEWSPIASVSLVAAAQSCRWTEDTTAADKVWLSQVTKSAVISFQLNPD